MPPKVSNFPLCRSGMARSASLAAATPPRASNSSPESSTGTNVRKLRERSVAIGRIDCLASLCGISQSRGKQPSPGENNENVYLVQTKMAAVPRPVEERYGGLTGLEGKFKWPAGKLSTTAASLLAAEVPFPEAI